MFQTTRTPVRKLIRRAAAALAVVATVGAASVAAPKSPLSPLPEASAEMKCKTEYGGQKFYPGPDTSKMYNDYFGRGPSMDHYLRDYVPQGLAMWHDWKGSQDIFLVGMHHKYENDHRSLLYGLTRQGKKAGTVHMPVGAHMGSVKVYKKWMYVQQDNSTIRKYALSWVRKQFGKPGAPYLGPGKVIKIRKVPVSYFDIYRGKLFAGYHDKSGRSVMYRYKIARNGDLPGYDRSWGPVQVPMKTQGVNVTDRMFYFSTSRDRHNRSNIYVVHRGYEKNMESVPYRCFRAPSMAQDIERDGDRLYLSFESGAQAFYSPGPGGDGVARNPISRLHQARLSQLS